MANSKMRANTKRNTRTGIKMRHVATGKVMTFPSWKLRGGKPCYADGTQVNLEGKWELVTQH